MNVRTGDKVRTPVTHVGCANCGVVVAVTELKYCYIDPKTKAVDYFCGAECSLEQHEQGRLQLAA